MSTGAACAGAAVAITASGAAMSPVSGGGKGEPATGS